jgi:hypothetical protein
MRVCNCMAVKRRNAIESGQEQLLDALVGHHLCISPRTLERPVLESIDIVRYLEREIDVLLDPG